MNPDYIHSVLYESIEDAVAYDVNRGIMERVDDTVDFAVWSAVEARAFEAVWDATEQDNWL